MGEELDDYAAELLERTVRPLARTIRAHGPDALAARWWSLTPEEQQDAVALLAAGFPVEDSTAEIYDWWLRPAKALPLHADEYYESPGPLVIAAEVPGDN